MLRRLRSVKYASAAIYGVVIVLLFAIERAHDIAGWLDLELAEPLVDASFWYQRLLSFPRRPLEPRYVTLVELDTQTLSRSTLSNACETRELVARLIKQLAYHHPRLIVGDIGFVRGNCSAGHPSTDLLRRSLRDVVRTTELVLGQPAVTVRNARALGRLSNAPPNIRLSRNELLLEDLEPFPEAVATGRLTFGAMMANEDLRVLPIEWRGREFKKSVPGQDVIAVPSLAYQAAMMHVAGEKSRSLPDLRWDSRHPFTSFVPLEKFTRMKAKSVLCGSNGTSWLNCRPPDPAISTADRRIQGKIVVFGWADNPADVHETGAGLLPGYVIHANYIEGLLDSRLHTSSPGWLRFLVTLIWFAVIEAIFLNEDWRTRKTVGLALTLTAVFAMGLWFLAITLRYYVAILPPILAAIPARGLQRWYERRSENKDGRGIEGSAGNAVMRRSRCPRRSHDNLRLVSQIPGGVAR